VGGASSAHGFVGSGREGRNRRRVVALVSGVGVTVALAVAVPGLASADPPPPPCIPSQGTFTCSYVYTGGEQTFVVPSGITSVKVIAIGAAGGADGSGNPGGEGEKVTGTLTGLSSGQTLYVEIGQQPDTATTGSGYNLPGSFNGGGGPGYGGVAGAGGGASDVRTISSTQNGSLASRLIVAGGGGGHSESYGTVVAPANAGANALPAAGTVYSGQGGFAGNNGGARGAAALNYSSAVGTAGSLGQGGNGAAGSPSGGGGGGGYFGGGGGGGGANNIGTGVAGGGGGGSSLVPSGGSDEGPTLSVASVTISYTPDHDLAIASHQNITEPATSLSGAVVTYTAPVVTDGDDASPPTAVCSPASGSKFAIGTTTVTCKAIDSDDTNSPVSTSFTVTVVGAAAQLADLYQAAQDTRGANGLAPIVAQAGRQAAGQHPLLACQTLNLFIIGVQRATPWRIPAGTSAELIAAARQIEAVLGCPAQRFYFPFRL
jgi:hypothetical protein